MRQGLPSFSNTEFGAQVAGMPAAGLPPTQGRPARRVGRPTQAMDTPVYGRASLPVGQVFQGPGVVEEPESTLVIGPAGRFTAEASGNITIQLAA